MPVGVLKNRVAQCHTCSVKDVPVTINGNLRRHKNARGFICKASNTLKQNRTKVKR